MYRNQSWALIIKLGNGSSENSHYRNLPIKGASPNKGTPFSLEEPNAIINGYTLIFQPK